MHLGNIRFGDPAQPVIGGGAAKVVLGVRDLDESRAEVFLACWGEGFGNFVSDVLRDHELGLTRVVMGNGRTLGGLIFVGKGKTLFLPFDAHSPTIRKIMRDWKKHRSIQCCIKTDLGGMGFISPLTNNILEKLLAVREDKFDTMPSTEMMNVSQAIANQLSQAAQVVSTPLIPYDKNGSLTNPS